MVIVFILFCCGLILANFTHIPRGYFIGTGASLWLPSASEATLKDMGKYITWIYKNITKQSTAKLHEYLIWHDVFAPRQCSFP